MQASSVGTPTAGHCGTIFVAIELSQKTWLVTLHSPDRDRISRYKLEGGDYAGLLAPIEKVRARAAQKLGSVPRVVSCYEAGYNGFWLHRLLEAAGIVNFVFDAASIAVEQRSRRSKTDRIDGELLLRTLMAYLRGEPRVVRIVRVPSVEQEDARRASRERDRYCALPEWRSATRDDETGSPGWNASAIGGDSPSRRIFLPRSSASMRG
jgi:transposase